VKETEVSWAGERQRQHSSLALDYLTTDAVNTRMEALGFEQARSMGRIGGGGDNREGKEADNKRFGLGATRPIEMVQILEKLDRGEIATKAASKEMIDLMKREQVRVRSAGRFLLPQLRSA